MPWLRHVYVLACKNWTIRRGQPFLLCVELLFPVLLISGLCFIRLHQPTVPKCQSHYDATVLPSGGFLPLVENVFCFRGGRPDGYGFNNYPNSSTRAILELVDLLATSSQANESMTSHEAMTSHLAGRIIRRLLADSHNNSLDIDVASVDVTSGTVGNHSNHSMHVDWCSEILGPKRNRSSLISGFILWSAIQKLVCGQNITVPNHVDSVAKFADFLGLSLPQRWHLADLYNMFGQQRPLLLYSPNTTLARAIMKQANVSLEYLDMLTNLSRSFVDAINKMNVSSLPPSLLSAARVSCAWQHLMANYSLDWQKGVASEREAVRFFSQGSAAADNYSVIAVIALDLPSSGRLPNHLMFKIRQNGSMTAPTRTTRDRVWLPSPSSSGPNYYTFGFVWIQEAIERAFIRLHARRDVIDPASCVQRTPYPCYIQDDFLFYQQTVVPLCCTMCWLGGVALLVHQLTQDQQNGRQQYLRTMGVSVWSMRLSAMSVSVLTGLVSVSVCCLLLCRSGKGAIFVYSDASLVFCLLALFVVSNSILAVLLSRLQIGSARVTSACATVFYFIMLVPFIYVSVMENTGMMSVSSLVKFIMCLSSPSAFNWAFKYISFYEQQGVGVQWSNFMLSPVQNDSFNMAATMLVMGADMLFYAAMLAYLDRVTSDASVNGGDRLPWYYPLMPRFWCGRRYNLLLNESSTDIIGGSTVVECGEDTNTTSVLQQADPDSLACSVQLSHVTKRYTGHDLPAVNDLTLAIYRGHVTALLGHNAAGKTTTLSMLCGLIRPTSGRITVYERRASGRILAVCPQYDTLFDGLTARQHATLVTRLVTSTYDKQHTTQFVESTLRQLRLQCCADRDVKLLSGGERRRVSVMLAWILAGDNSGGIIVLDEPTSAVDPLSRRAIWDLISLHKHERTIILCTHHMDEAEILADRIVVMATGKLKCVGSPMFLRRHFASGYHLYLSKSPLDVASSSSGDVTCRHSQLSRSVVYEDITSLLRHHAPGAVLMSGGDGGASSGEEMHYFIPAADSIDAGRIMTSLLAELELHSRPLGVASYNVRTTSMNEVFARLTRGQTEAACGSGSEELQCPRAGGNIRQHDDDVDAPVCEDICFDQVTSQVQMCQGWRLLWQRWAAIFLLRFYCARQNWAELISQVLVPCVFTMLAMGVSKLAPSISDQPALLMSPSQYFNYTLPAHNVVPFSNHKLDLLVPGYSRDASSLLVENTLKLASGLGATCVLQDPFNSSRGFDVLCDSVLRLSAGVRANIVDKIAGTSDQLSRDVNFTDTGASTFMINSTINSRHTHRMYPQCKCRTDGAGFRCERAGYSLPRGVTLVTSDLLVNVTGQNESNYYLYTTDLYRLRRYGGLSLGLTRAVVPRHFGRNLSPLLRQTAVRRVAKCWYNIKGFHSMPAYLNALNNQILRANLPPNSGNPAGYGVSCINHPLPGTETFSLQQQIQHGSSQLVALFLLAAVSCPAASHLLQLVSEKHRLRQRHLQEMAGVDAAIYWSSNLCWHLLYSCVPSLVSISLIAAFNDAQYSSGQNLAGISLLILVYGWTITPILYPVSFLISDPATAYIIAIFGSISLGLATLLITSMLEATVSAATMYMLKTVFMLVPGFNLARAVVDMAYNHYHNVFLQKTGSQSQAVSPLSMALIGRYLVAMATMAIGGILLVVLLEMLENRRKRTVSKTCHISAVSGRLNCEDASCDDNRHDVDEDVVAERRRVIRDGGATERDFLQLVELSKVARASGSPHKLVDCLTFAVKSAEVFGLLGVNGAGKTTTFRMLTGETLATSGAAMVKQQLSSRSIDGASVGRPLSSCFSSVGFCPQYDALVPEMTVWQHMIIRAMMCGVCESDRRAHILFLLRLVGMSHSHTLSSRCAELSAGSKRKISVALALIGWPHLLLLDEPTTGMDPASRLQFGRLVRHLVARRRTAVLMTSHSMHECEWLCDRLAIMTSGHLRCLGHPQYLRQKFGAGYTVTVRRSQSCQSCHLQAIMHDKLATLHLKESYEDVLVYHVASADIKLNQLFEQLQQLTTSDDVISEYHVTQNTLDNVFVKLACEAAG